VAKRGGRADGIVCAAAVHVEGQLTVRPDHRQVDDAVRADCGGAHGCHLGRIHNPRGVRRLQEEGVRRRPACRGATVES
jgi:hypothetical protein